MESVNATSFRVASHCVGHTTTAQSGNLPSFFFFHLLLLSGWYRRVFTLLLEAPSDFFHLFFPFELGLSLAQQSKNRLLGYYTFATQLLYAVSEVDDNIEASLESRAESSLVYRRETIIFHPLARNPLEPQQGAASPASPAVYRRWITAQPTHWPTPSPVLECLWSCFYWLVEQSAYMLHTEEQSGSHLHTHTHTCLCFLYSCWSNGPSKTSKGSSRE